MVFDDLHWIDPSSRELLDRTVECIANWPVLLLVLFRPEFQPPWIGQPHATMLTLARLDKRNAAAMVANVAGSAMLSAEIVEEIAERTDGVPLFVEELTKAVLEAGEQAAALSAVPHRGPVPATLHASLMSRLDRLGPAVKEVAQTGAAIGREFGYALVASITKGPEPELNEVLDRLTRAGLLFVRGLPPHSTYIFKHALVQDAAYGTMLRGRRKLLHARIAATLEDRFPEITLAQPALLAWHYSEADLAKSAVDYWLKAGRQALARSAFSEAIALLRRGLGVLGGLPENKSRQQQELDLLAALRPALGTTKGHSAKETHETLLRARALSEQLDRSEHLVSLLWGQWQHHSSRAEFRLALPLGEQLEEIGKTRNDAATQSLGLHMQGAARLFLGEFVAARAAFERGLGLSDPADPAYRSVELSPVDPYATTLAYLALTLAYLGYIDQAGLQLDEALSETRRSGRVATRAVVLILANWMDWLTGLPMVHHEEFLALTTEHHFPLLGWALAFRGRSLTVCGKAQEGLTVLSQALAELRPTGTVLNSPVLFTWLADAHAMLGQSTEEQNCRAEATRIVETTEERMDEAELLHRVLGDLLNGAGDRSAAEQHYLQAIAVAERQSAKLFQLRASVSLGRLWRNQGKRAEARDLLGPIYSWFTEGFDAPDLKEAKALLDELA